MLTNIAIKSLYAPCMDYGFYDSLKPNMRNRAIKNCITQFCLKYASGKAMDAVSSTIAGTYKDEWFSYAWQKEQAMKDDYMLFVRLSDWLGEKAAISLKKPVYAPIGDNYLEGCVDLIVKDETGYLAINIFNSTANKSFGGKDTSTNIKYDLFAMVAKYDLEEQYPNVRIANVYLKSPDDIPGKLSSSFTVSNTRSSNVFVLSFDDYYRNNKLVQSELLDAIVRVANSPQKKSCFGCRHEELCKCMPLIVPSLVNEPKGGEKGKLPVPRYTQSQQKVITHMDGPMMVLAGPGSGKTAALVGRIKHMLEAGIDSDYILAITFTREAANELKNRVSSFTNDIPVISTIHALCFGILKTNQSILNKEIKLLTPDERASIISGLLQVFPPIKGFSYTDMAGLGSLIKSVERKIDKYFGKFKGDKDLFLKEEKKLSDDFVSFSNVYQDIIEKRGYISFNEQITLCTNLLKENPDVLAKYQELYRYVMIDEFQDIDASQAEFIYLLAGKFKNLVVVGDDDQSIYSFRGGSNRYMLEFNKAFPGAETIVFKENFRSNSSLVSFSQGLIKKNKERIEKNIVATRNGCGKPLIVNSTSVDTIDKAVAEFVKNGYSYSDIAILATKNASLEELSRTLKCPSVLEKSYLRNDSFFLLIKDIFSLLLNIRDNYSFYHLLRLFDEDIRPINEDMYSHILGLGYKPLGEGNYKKEPQGNLERALTLLDQVICAVKAGNTDPAFLIANIAIYLGMGEEPSLVSVQSLVTASNVTDVRNAVAIFSALVENGDETRVDVSGISAVRLITDHDSKGREFDNVIVIDDFSDEETEEGRRLLYVAMTRAKDNLVILTQKESFYGLGKEAV